MPETVRLVITRQLPRWSRERLAAVDPRLQLRYVPVQRPDFRTAAFPTLKRYPSPEEVEAALREADILIGELPQALPSRAPALRWLQLPHTGLQAHDLPLLQQLAPGVLVTNASGTPALSIAEWVMAACLYFVRNYPRLLAAKAQRRWDYFVASELRDKTLGIVGFGNIGRATTPLAKAFGMRVIAADIAVQERQHNVQGADELLPADHLQELLAASDFVLLSLPLTPATHHLIGERELRAMKPTAYLLNMSRGQIVDEGFLLRALKEGWIAGAALDVFEKEPLPPESELWGLPNVLVAPHVAGVTDAFNERLTGLLCENLRRFLAGKPLLNLVERQRAY